MAKAPATPSQSFNIGRTASRTEGTVNKKIIDTSTWMINGNHLLPPDGVECILLRIPIMLRDFLSSSVICSLIFYYTESEMN